MYAIMGLKLIIQFEVSKYKSSPKITNNLLESNHLFYYQDWMESKLASNCFHDLLLFDRNW